jgi:acyl-CoA thioesterase FadM
MFSYRYVVGTRDCDALGHLNVSGYYSFCNLAGFALLEDIGWKPGAANAGRRYSFAVLKSQTEFLAEVLAGQALIVWPMLRDLGGKSAVFDYRIVPEDGGAPVFRSSWVTALMDLDSRRSVTIPDDLRAALRPHLADGPDWEPPTVRG